MDFVKKKSVFCVFFHEKALLTTTQMILVYSSFILLIHIMEVSGDLGFTLFISSIDNIRETNVNE